MPFPQNQRRSNGAVLGLGLGLGLGLWSDHMKQNPCDA